MDLGQYKFTDDDGYCVLEIQKSDRTPVIINDPYAWTPPVDVVTQSDVTQMKPGTLVATEFLGTTTKRKAEATLELDLTKQRKRLRTKH